MIETNTQLLQKIEQKLKTNQIGFWIENQDCYLWENTFHYSNKIKVGNLSQTRENYYFQLLEEVKKLGEASKVRRQFLDSKFLEISDVDLIKELNKRIIYKPTIKLSMYAGNQTIFVEGEDIKSRTGITLPIEIKEKDENV